MKAGMIMDYTLKRLDKNIVIMELENKTKIIIRFREEDNPDIEDIITNNLMMSYEQRMKDANKLF